MTRLSLRAAFVLLIVRLAGVLSAQQIQSTFADLTVPGHWQEAKQFAAAHFGTDIFYDSTTGAVLQISQQGGMEKVGDIAKYFGGSQAATREAAGVMSAAEFPLQPDVGRSGVVLANGGTEQQLPREIARKKRSASPWAAHGEFKIAGGIAGMQRQFGERSGFPAGDGDGADRSAVAQHRHREQAAVASFARARAKRLGIGRIGLDVGDPRGLAAQRCLAERPLPCQGRREQFSERFVRSRVSPGVRGEVQRPLDKPGYVRIMRAEQLLRAARDCAVVNGQMVMRVGVQGRIIVGPAGGAGSGARRRQGWGCFPATGRGSLLPG